MHIIATIGPKSYDKWILKELIGNGVDILRLNCSHFNDEEFKNIINWAKEIKKDIHIMVDLCGRKIRVSQELAYIYKIYNGQEIYFCGEDFYKNIDRNNLNDMKLIPLTLKSDDLLKSNVSNISMKDNTMNFQVLGKKYGLIHAKVLKGGIIRAGKGCNIPNLKHNKNYLSDKDKENIKWAINNDINIICQSFVESLNEINIVKEYIKNELKVKVPEIWAKVETPKGIKNLREIIQGTDTIVIGRGDLVPESGILDAVQLEYEAIKFLVENNKKTIIATHLLNSMKNGQQATFPEVESIYTFINKGVDGFLLAGETSIGKVPIKTINFFNEIINYYKIDKEKSV
ncbi:hypothetical protein JCM1393_00990 [Clostridium carnis]